METQQTDPDVISNLWVCTDCVMYIANGELPEEDADVGRAILDGIERERPYDWVCESPHDDEGEGADQVDFSWRACECCNSHLGGSRHRCALILVKGRTP